MLIRFIFLILVFSCQTAAAEFDTTLARFIKEPENISTPWIFDRTRYSTLHQVSIDYYTLSSQTWPKPSMSSDSIVWKHALIIYRPDTINTDQALLFVNEGVRYPIQTNHSGDNPAPETIDFARIAQRAHSIVIDLQNVPNEYITFDNNIPIKEDALLAYTWKRYLDDPIHGEYWPLHLPMTKSIIKAMDAVQQILKEKNQITVSHFVVSGSSKRGWATWLAALSDNRINGIIPIVVDVFKTPKNVCRIYDAYNHWSIGQRNDASQKRSKLLDSPALEALLRIEDPLSYLSDQEHPFYKERLSIPKYTINANTNDFFEPNLPHIALPGRSNIRIVPNQCHYINMKIVEHAILAYYKNIILDNDPPSLEWSLNSDQSIDQVKTISRQQPIVKLWEATNLSNHDFRLEAGVRYVSSELKGSCIGQRCTYPVVIASPEKGWKSSFVEVTFLQNDERLILTTSNYITKSLQSQS